MVKETVNHCLLITFIKYLNNYVYISASMYTPKLKIILMMTMKNDLSTTRMTVLLGKQIVLWLY